jgi:ribose transport system permease protein
MKTIGLKVFTTFKRQPVWFILLISASLFSILSHDFLTVQNLANIVLQSSVLGIMAVGMTGLMISGYFDISVGSMIALLAAVAVSLTGFSIPLAIVLTLVGGSLLGAVNGLLVTKAKVNAFIVTLAAMVGFRGLVYVYTGEREIIGMATEFEFLAAGKIAFVPIPIVIWVLTVVIAEWTLRKTVHGRNTYAIGGDAEAASNAGVPTDRYVLALFIINGFLVAIAALVLASRLNAATPTLGIGQEMIVIISVVMGGTKLTGGFGNMIKTVAGVLTIGMIQNGLNILNVHHFYSMLIMGLIFIFVIFMDTKLSTAG